MFPGQRFCSRSHSSLALLSVRSMDKKNLKSTTNQFVKKLNNLLRVPRYNGTAALADKPGTSTEKKALRRANHEVDDKRLPLGEFVFRHGKQKDKPRDINNVSGFVEN